MACPGQSICLFCQPNRDQREPRKYGTQSNQFTYSRCPNVDKTNVTPSQWRGNGLRKVSRFRIHSRSETYVLQKRREALISPAWSLYAFRTTRSNHVTCTSPKYYTPGEQKESIMCDFDLRSEVYYQRFTVSTLTKTDRFILAFRTSSLGTFW